MLDILSLLDRLGYLSSMVIGAHLILIFAQLRCKNTKQFRPFPFQSYRLSSVVGVGVSSQKPMLLIARE